MKYSLAHNNFTVLHLNKSIAFYEKALGLQEESRVEAPDGSFIMAFLSDEESHHVVELTWIKDKKEPDKDVDNEFHLAFYVDDYETSLKKHKDMKCVSFVNEQLGAYFITDPDGYWIEILPTKQ